VTLVAGSITIKELHTKTGEYVRRAGRSRVPLYVTDRGKLVAVLVSPALLPGKRRHRTLIPEYAVLLGRSNSADVLEDLNAIRGDR
jgi:prevent-host-death family protein